MVLEWYIWASICGCGDSWVWKLTCKKFPDHTKVWSGKLNSKDTQLSHINLGHLGDTLWIYINGSRMVHLGFNMWLRRQLSMKINIPKSSPDHTKVWSGKLNSKDTQLSRINLGHLGDTLWIYINVLEWYIWGLICGCGDRWVWKINIPKSSLTTQKCGQGNLTQKILNYLTSTRDTLEAHYGYIQMVSREVPWGWNIQFQSQMSMNHTKVKDFSHMLKTFCTNLAHLGDTLGTYRNCSRVVHWEQDKHLWTQMCVEIKVLKRAWTTQKLRTF